MLEQLSNAIGVSGGEREVRSLIIEKASQYGAVKTDRMGNVYVHKQGSGPKIMCAAHMDEVGMMVIGIKEDGTLAYSAAGIDPRVAVSKRVLVGKEKIPGVIGAKAIHLQRPEERTTMPKHESLFIDIGCESRAEAEKYVKRGDFVGFDTQFSHFGDGLMKGKALDDRVGCAVVLALLERDYDCDFYGVFTVQEEIGMRGATATAYNVEPDILLNFEGTTANDMPGAEGHTYVTKVGEGPALSIMDMGTIVKPQILDALVRAAKDGGIPFQYRKGARGGTDAGVIHKALAGCYAAGISVPCRYIHSPVSVASRRDFEQTIELADFFLKNKRFEEVLS